MDSESTANNLVVSDILNLSLCLIAFVVVCLVFVVVVVDLVFVVVVVVLLFFVGCCHGLMAVIIFQDKLTFHSNLNELHF